MADLQLQLKLTADGSGLTGTLRTSTGELRTFSTQAKAANDAVSSLASGGITKLGVQFGAAAALGNKLFEVAGDLIGKFPELVAQSINYAASVGDIAQRTGVAAEGVSGIASAARLAGSDINAVSGLLDTFGNNATKAAGGGKQQVALFSAMGISVRDAGGHLKSTDALLEESTRKLAGYADGAAKTALAERLFGGNAKELMPVLDQLGKEGLQGVIDKAGELGQVIDGDMAAAAGRVQVQMRTLREEVTGYATRVASDVLPVVLQLADAWIENDTAARGTSQSFDGARTSTTGVGQAVKDVIAYFIALYGAVQQVGVYIADFFVRLKTDWDYTKAQLSNGDWLRSFGTAVAGAATGNVAVVSASLQQMKGVNAELDAQFAARREGNAQALKASLADIETNTTGMLDKLLASTHDAVAGINGEAGHLSGGDAPIPKFGKQADEAGKAMRRLALDALSAQQFLDGLSQKMAGPYEKAWGEYQAAIDQADKMAIKFHADKMAEADVQRFVAEATRIATENLRDQTDASGAISRVIASANSQLDHQRELLGTTAKQQKVHETYTRLMTQADRELAAAMGPLTAADQARLNSLHGIAQTMVDVEEESSKFQDVLSQYGEIDSFDKLVSDIARVEEALKKATDPETIERMQRALGNLNKTMEQRNIGLMQQGVSSLQQYAKEGTAAYTALGIAQDVLAYKSAIAAIANQGSGDPYSAFARIAAMIALMASIGIRVGGAGGGFADTAKQRQETQGTGSVLGDAAAKSESIAKAVDITAKATTALVGINRGMLDALHALQNALGAASTQLARGAGDASFNGTNPLMLNAGNGAAIGAAIGTAFMPVIGTIVGGLIGAVVGKLLGGSSKVTDQGLMLSGGSLDNVGVNAYQTTQYKTWRFGSTHTSDEFAAVSDEFNVQFRLVIASIVGTVRQGALALGVLPADVEAALAAYRIEETRISLKGLSAEDAQKELEAVFSKIFDNLAGSVVPFVAKYQQVGEGLGETLVRVATEVQVTQEGFKQLGIAVRETDPEKFADIADGLINAAGGMDAFISGLNSFVQNFAPESHKMEVSSNALTSALGQVGLTLPTTSEGMWALMQSLDDTTEEGRKQIATLLRLSDVAKQYYDQLDEQTKKLADAKSLLESLGLASGLSQFGKELQSIHDSETKAVDAANLLAKAQGREGASTVQIAQIHDWASKQIAAALKRLQVETRDIVAQLYGGMPASLDAINEQISKLESAAGDTSQISDAQQASNALFESWKNGIKSVQDYLDSMLLGDLSALTPEERLAEAKRQLVSTQQAALGGDADALAKLPQMADAFLRLERQFDASGGDYNAQFDWVRQLLGSVTGMPNPGTQASNAIQVAVTASPELQALYEARDAALKEQENEHRAQLAQQLAQNLHDLAVLTRTPILDMIDLQGVALDKLATDMGVDLNNLTGNSVLALGNMATTLGVSLTDLTSKLGINLTDLGAGVTELTGRLGIDLGNLTVSSTETLAQLANSLGADLGDLATSVGVDLGTLTDKQSLLNEALADTIGQLPDGTRDQLAPLLEAITDATSEADANNAIKALEDAVNLLAPDLRDQLAPYLAGVNPSDALTDLDYLSSLQDIGHDQLDVLRDIARGLNVPGYAVGTGYVPQTGLALIHQGESIFPAPVASWMRANGFPVVQTGGGSAAANDAMVVELRALRAELADLKRVTTASGDKVASSVERGDARAQSQRDEIARNTRGSMSRSTYG